jgi:hypothetical protein
MNNPNFHTAIRIWDDQPGRAPEIFCVCVTCLNFWIGYDTYGMQQWMNFHPAVCPAHLMPSTLPEEIEKAFSKLRNDK